MGKIVLLDCSKSLDKIMVIWKNVGMIHLSIKPQIDAWNSNGLWIALMNELNNQRPNSKREIKPTELGLCSELGDKRVVGLGNY
jgi:hypothetical protein